MTKYSSNRINVDPAYATRIPNSISTHYVARFVTSRQSIPLNEHIECYSIRCKLLANRYIWLLQLSMKSFNRKDRYWTPHRFVSLTTQNTKSENPSTNRAQKKKNPHRSKSARACNSLLSLQIICRGDWIWTSDPLLPKQVRYRAAPHPEFSSTLAWLSTKQDDKIPVLNRTNKILLNP